MNHTAQLSISAKGGIKSFVRKAEGKKRKRPGSASTITSSTMRLINPGAGRIISSSTALLISIAILITNEYNSKLEKNKQN